MNFYKRYMADYAKKTARLTLAQHGAYTLLLDELYGTELPLPQSYDELNRICRAMIKAEQEAVKFVADQYFPVCSDGLRHNNRATEELFEAAPAIEAARLNGKRGGRPKKEPSGFPTNNPVGFQDVTQTKPSSKAPHSSEEEEEAKASLPEPAVPAKPSPPACPIDSLIDSFTTHLPGMPTVNRGLFKAGKGGEAMRARWRWVMTSTHERGAKKGEPLAQTAADGIAWFDRFFTYVSGSDFLTGRDGKWAACDLHWLMTASKFEAVLGGKYHTKEVAAA